MSRLQPAIREDEQELGFLDVLRSFVDLLSMPQWETRTLHREVLVVAPPCFLFRAMSATQLAFTIFTNCCMKQVFETARSVCSPASTPRAPSPGCDTVQHPLRQRRHHLVAHESWRGASPLLAATSVTPRLNWAESSAFNSAFNVRPSFRRRL